MREAGIQDKEPVQPTPADPIVKILLVDDQPANLLALRAILEDLGQDLVEARSGEEALERLAEHDFAVVLLDVQMHGLDGFETARRIRRREPSRHTPIIFLTAYEDNRLPLEDAYALGAVDYLVKPLVPVILRAKVAGFVELFQKTEQVKSQAERLRQLERRAFEERLAEENARLRESEQYHRAIAELASDFAYAARVDPEGTVILDSVTAGFSRVTGYTLVELNARGGWATALFAADLPVTAQSVERLLSGQDAKNDARFLTKTGEVRWIHFLGHPVWDADHTRVVRICGAVQDITERKRAEEVLQESERRFRTLARHAPVGIFQTDALGNCLFVNERWCQAAGLSPEEAKGEGWIHALHPDDRDRVFQEWYARRGRVGRSLVHTASRRPRVRSPGCKAAQWPCATRPAKSRATSAR